MGGNQSVSYSSLTEKNRCIDVLRNIKDIKVLIETKYGASSYKKINMLIRSMEYSFQLQDYLLNSDLEDKDLLLLIISDCLNDFE